MKWILPKPTTKLKCQSNKPGESIEEKLRRALSAGEPIDAIAPLQFTDRKDGVLAQFDHRADPLEIAQDAAQKYYGGRIEGFRKAEELKIAQEAAMKAAAEAAKQAPAQPEEGV